MKTIFGPVNSRRFGNSLGIDLSPAFKQCNFDCLYCELAPSAPVEKQTSVVEVATIIDELKEHLDEGVDVLTITANGEPTLYPHLDALIDAFDKLKKNTQTLILTNSSGLVDPKVFNSLLRLDQVKLSLDAITPSVFKRIDRPYVGIEIEPIVAKAIEFSHVYQGKLFIEILFVHGLNDTKEEIQKLSDVLLKMNVTRIDLGTIDRPPAYPIEGLNYKELHEAALLFDSSLPIHIVSRSDAEPHKNHYDDEEILNTLDKRPLTEQDIDLLLDEESKERFLKLVEASQIIKKKVGNLEFFLLHENEKRKRAK